MSLWTPESVDLAQIAAVPDRSAVFMIHTREGSPYLGKTARLNRRLQRLLGARAHPSRLLHLRDVATRIEYRLTASWLETSLVLYDAARMHFPGTYRELLKLRLPPYLKIQLANPFPRSYITSRLGGARGPLYGPFRTRAAAEEYQNQFLSLFQMRRCREDLVPAPGHPGCIYGEMNLCLRPCQQAVGQAEYRSEVDRAVEFLSSGGRSLLDALVQARDQCSAEMDFEQAARLHKQVEKVQAVRKLAGGLACDIDRLHGVAVTRSVEEGSAEVWFMLQGCWHPPIRAQASGSLPIPLNRPLLSTRERQDHLALLARWYYASSRDGDWLSFADPHHLPNRKLRQALQNQGQYTQTPFS